jgi:predicted component of type VI protein secretion system
VRRHEAQRPDHFAICGVGHFLQFCDHQDFGAYASDASLEHDPEKWIPVFRKDHAQTGDPEMGDYDDEPTVIFRKGQFPSAFD